MAYVSNQNNSGSNNKELEKAVSWINVYVIGGDGKRHKVGAIPLNESKPVQSRVHTACAKNGLDSIADYLQLEWQPGTSGDPAKLDLPF